MWGWWLWICWFSLRSTGPWETSWWWSRAATRNCGKRCGISKLGVDLLKKFEAALPQAGKGLEDFTANRIPPRREAFSTAAHLIHKVADAAGVKLSSTAYRLDTEHHDPLERLAIDINAQGSYTGLLKFSHALETANDFILVRDFNIGPGDNGALSLRLDADLYLTP